MPEHAIQRIGPTAGRTAANPGVTHAKAQYEGSNRPDLTMARQRIPAPVWTGSADETEAAFYEALQSGDLDRVMACWADDADIVCIHPGGARLVGGEAIRAAFASILAQGHWQIRPGRVLRLAGSDSAVHSVREEVQLTLPDGVHHAAVVATNVYQRTAHGWRLVAHHASAASADDDAQALPPASTLLH